MFTTEFAVMQAPIGASVTPELVAAVGLAGGLGTLPARPAAAEAPLFIDDSPNLTMMEIRAKARRLRQRHDLKLVVIDYIQLMTSGKKVESRQLEVSEFSRQLKLLAKELGVPVVALSKLNRGPEQRGKGPACSGTPPAADLAVS